MAPGSEAPFPGRPLRIGFWVFLGAIGLLRVLAVFTENVNWDELALLHRAEGLANSGLLRGGGRPGLVVLVLLPAAKACSDAIATIVAIRHVWTALTIASACLLLLLLRRVLPDTPTRPFAVGTGLGLWVLSPTFLRYSVQVRTDMPAIFFGLLGSLALLESRNRRGLAFLGGCLLGVGFLFSQKLVYIAALGGLLVTGWHVLHREVSLPRESLRIGLAVLGFLVTVGAYSWTVTRWAGTAPPLLPVAGAMTTFEYYRAFVGWRHYLRLVPQHPAQAIGIALVPILILLAISKAGRAREHALVATAVLFAGLGVTLFHAGRFPYFYPVLGLFPAVVGALAIGPVLENANSPRIRALFLLAIWIPLTAGSVSAAITMVREDDQLHQRRALAFVSANFSEDAQGFNGRAAFVCRGDLSPFPVWFGEHMPRVFGPGNANATVAALIGEFRDRPVQFMIEPEPWESYPAELRQFWQTRYVEYFGKVKIPGRAVIGAGGWQDEFEVIVSGEYRWWSSEESGQTLVVDGVEVLPGERIRLGSAGTVSLTLPEGGRGIFSLVLDDAPDPGGPTFFRRF